MDEYRRPSTWAAAAGIGLLAVAVALLGNAGAWPRALLLGLAWAGGTLAALQSLPVFLWLVAEGLSLTRDWRATFQPAAPVAAEDEAESEQPAYDAEREAWRLALTRFFSAGDRAGGFSARKLDGVVGSDTWPRLVHFYASAEGGNVLRDAGGDTGFTWGHGWNNDRVSLALHADSLPRPAGPLPTVEVYVADSTRRDTPRQRKTPARVVENTPRPAP